MNKVLLVISLLVSTSLSAQIYPEWSKSIGSLDGYEFINSSTKDENGNTYIFGGYRNTVFNGDKLYSENGSIDVYIAKYDKNLALVWIYPIKGSGGEDAKNIAYYDGHVYIAFTGSNSITFNSASGPSTEDLGAPNVYVIAKYSVNGEFVFAEKLSERTFMSLNDLEVDANGIYAAGSFTNTATFGNISGSSVTYTSAGNIDGFIANYELDGSLKWVTRFANPAKHYVNAISLNQNDVFFNFGFEYYFDVNTQSTSNFDQLYNGTVGFEIGIGKLDSNGELKWVKRIGANIDLPKSVKMDNDGSELFLIGDFNGTVNFNSPSAAGTNEISSAGLQDIFIARYDTSGVFSWVSRLGGTSSEQIGSIKILEDQLLIGIVSSSTKMNFSNPYVAGVKEINSGGMTDIFLALYSKSGRFIKGHRMGGKGIDFLTDMSYSNNELTAVGYYADSINFNTSSSFTSNSFKPFGGTQHVFLANYKYDLLPSFQKGGGAFNGGGGHESHAILADSEGNMYVTGYFTGSAVFGDVTLQGQGGKDVFVIKYDADGKKVWAKRAGGTGDDEGNALVLADGYLYVTGSFESTANFNTPYVPLGLEMTSAGNKDIFLAKYAISDGSALLIRRAGGAGEDEGKGICSDGTDLYLTGKFNGTANFNTPSSSGSNELVSAGLGDAFVGKYSTLGNVIWLKRGGGTGEDIGRSIDVSLFSLYVGGSYEGISNFNTPSSTPSNQLVSAGEKDGFLWKLSKQGIIQWAKRMGGPKTDELYGLDVVGNDCYVTGFFTDSTNFQNSGSSLNLLRSAGQRDVFLAKFNQAGTLIWNKRAGGTLNDIGTAIKVSNDIIYTCGVFRNSIDFNTPSATSANDLISDGLRDFYTAQYTTDGDFIKVKRGGGTDDDLCFDIDVEDGIVYSAGTFSGTINFNTPSNNSSNVLNSVTVPFLFFARSQPDLVFDIAKTEGTRNGGVSAPKVIGKDADGNLYLAGTLEYWTDFKVDTLENGLFNTGYILKMDKNGTNKWVKPLTTEDDIRFEDISVLNNKVMVVGSFFENMSYSADFSENVVHSSGDYDGFVLSIDTSGVFLGLNRFGGAGHDEAVSVKNNGSSFFVGGSISDSASFTSYTSVTVDSIYGYGSKDVIIARYETNGSLSWVKNAGSTGDDNTGEIDIYNNQIFAIGAFGGQMHFHNSSQFIEKASTTYIDMFIACFDINGNYVWAKRAGSDDTFYTTGVKLAVNSNGVFLTGVTLSDTLNFAPAGTSTLNRVIYPDILDFKGFVAKFLLDGSFSWAKGISSYTEVLNIYPSDFLFHDGKLLLALYFSGDINFNNLNPPASGQLFSSNGIGASVYAVYDYAGNFNYAQLHGSEVETTTYQFLSANNAIYAVGSFPVGSSFAHGQSHKLLPPLQPGIVKFVSCANSKNLTKPLDNYSDGIISIMANELSGAITASNLIIPSAKAEYQGKSILLNPGFEAQSGTVFTAEPGGCF